MFDLAIIGGTVIDPVLKRLIPANVYVKDGKVAEISRVKHIATEEIDAHGKYVSAGFIDIHTHSDSNNMVGEMLAKQGVTTSVSGNCGYGQTDIVGFFEKTEKDGYILNQSMLAGATELRERAGLLDALAPMNEEQISFAEKALEADFEAGASGLSFGLGYMVGSSTEEILRLSKVAARFGKPVAIHTRAIGGGWGVLGGVVEAIDISRKTGAPVHISHVVYEFGYDMMSEALEIIDEAVHEGVDISCDSGMYTSFATFIGTEVFEEEALSGMNCDFEDIVMASGKYTGQRLDRELYIEVRKNHPNDVANAMIGNPHEIPIAFDFPYMMCSSDAGVSALAGVDFAVHPQDAATFPLFIRESVVNTGQLTLVDAISRITSLPAMRMGMKNKGRLAKGADADITIFDLQKLKPRANFPHLGTPSASPEGIEAVIINGKVAVRNDNIVCSNAGKILRSPNTIFKY